MMVFVCVHSMLSEMPLLVYITRRMDMENAARTRSQFWENRGWRMENGGRRREDRGGSHGVVHILSYSHDKIDARDEKSAEYFVETTDSALREIFGTI